VYGFTQLEDIAIEIIEAGVDIHSDDTWSTVGYDFEEAFCVTPSIGVGLGLSDSRSTGTLGGYLRLSTAVTSKYVALTCHHVLSGTFLGPIPPSHAYSDRIRWSSADFPVPGTMPCRLMPFFSRYGRLEDNHSGRDSMCKRVLQSRTSSH
jgi:hypothetical protein